MDNKSLVIDLWPVRDPERHVLIADLVISAVNVSPDLDDLLRVWGIFPQFDLFINWSLLLSP